ncbi:DUF6192 family protein [Streptomyces sp. NPDC055060]
MHTLAQDHQIAAQISGDLLRRPTAAGRFTSEVKVFVVEAFTRDRGSDTGATAQAIVRPGALCWACLHCRHGSGSDAVHGGLGAVEHHRRRAPDPSTARHDLAAGA